MAERSTAAVDVADNDGEKPSAAQAETATTDGAGTETMSGEASESQEAGEPGKDVAARPDSAGAEGRTSPPELHSGHKLARRYRLEECVTRLDGFSSWRAVDEKLRRAVGVHILPADHPRARPVLAAARSAALLGDPRFVQVLDAVEENDLVYVVHEWLPDATELTAVLAAGPFEPHDAYQLVSQVSQAMAAAHREGLAHLRLNPGSVLRTESGQYRIRGLAVMAALRGISSDHPQRTDTEAIGALLYAALTQRWPYESDAYGLPGLPKGVGLIAPDQVRAGVHRGLSDLAMRALVNDGATASRQEPPCTTPEELAKAVAAMPRIRPPEPSFAPPEAFQQRAYGPPPIRNGRPGPAVPAPVPPPPPLQSRTGKVLKWTVSALLIAALGLGSWQLADTLLKSENRSGDSQHQDKKPGGGAKKHVGKPIAIQGAAEYAPDGTPQDDDKVQLTYDTGPDSKGRDSLWRTRGYNEGPKFAPSIKKGVGIVYDLGGERRLGGAEISLLYPGTQSTYTEIGLYATDSLHPTGSSQTPLSGFKELLKPTQTGETTAKLTINSSVKTRYVLVWLTALPESPPEQYFERPFKQAITDVKFTD
ncbi:protein kinase family protein [Streptomyces palmae]|uniref:Serine/threonine protein kinase n=1 Tax=Streptomyces palmae TaxID=1701085 RepID=A0A4Z0HEY7_9ACTN|nr:protein kinase family protein [Streptomyces palmae]TGB17485.1 serine/threonine protein kinase [Streptomyces palmae]